MKKINILFFGFSVFCSVVFIFSCAGNKNLLQNQVEFYITPRNVNYGWGDNGVFMFSLNKQSVKVPFAKRTYTIAIEKDSVYELQYLQRSLDKQLLKKVEGTATINSDLMFSTPRILIILNNKMSSDTLSIDSYYNLKRGGKVYKIDKSLKEYLISVMPLELAESWLYNKMQR